MNLRELREATEGLLAEYRSAATAVKRERRALKKARAKQKSLAEALAIAQQIAEQVQLQAHQHIAKLVTRCLHAIFDDPYEFVILFEKKRGKTEARMVFRRNGMEVDPMTASGGGVIDITAFALRIAVILTKQPAPRRLLILDEPFRFVSVEYRPRIRILLETLAKELDFQFVIVTHISDLEIGTVHQL